MTRSDASPPRILVGVAEFDAFNESDVVARVRTGLDAGTGGWIVTPNADILRTLTREPSTAALTAPATIVVADGAPLIWAARLAGTPLPERVTGSSLVFSLAQDLAASKRSVFLLGGADGVPESAARELRVRFPGLRIAGTYSPPQGFDVDEEGLRATVTRVVESGPDVVFVGLGFPKQERVIRALQPHLPQSWFLGCGAAISMAAGATPRAPGWLQAVGLEWLFRLAQEPRRLAGRYLRRDLPFVVQLLARAAVKRLSTGQAQGANRTTRR